MFYVLIQQINNQKTESNQWVRPDRESRNQALNPACNFLPVLLGKLKSSRIDDKLIYACKFSNALKLYLCFVGQFFFFFYFLLISRTQIPLGGSNGVMDSSFFSLVDELGVIFLFFVDAANIAKEAQLAEIADLFAYHFFFQFAQ